jgi:hypothetical protein
VLAQRKLAAVEDVLVGGSLGAVLDVEDLGDPPRRVSRGPVPSSRGTRTARAAAA